MYQPCILRVAEVESLLSVLIPIIGKANFSDHPFCTWARVVALILGVGSSTLTPEVKSYGSHVSLAESHPAFLLSTYVNTLWATHDFQLGTRT